MCKTNTYEDQHQLSIEFCRSVAVGEPSKVVSGAGQSATVPSQKTVSLQYLSYTHDVQYASTKCLVQSLINSIIDCKKYVQL